MIWSLFTYFDYSKSLKKKKKDLIANSLVNLISESIKNLLVKKKLENETHANRVEA